MPEGLPVGTPAPDWTAPSVHGPALGLSDVLARGRPALLVFVDPGCGPCTALLPEVAQWQRDHTDRLTVVAVSRGDAAANRAEATEHELTHLLLQRDREIADAYRADGTPAAVLVGADGRIASPVRGGAAGVRELLGIALRPAPPPAAGPGDPVPPFALPARDGFVVALEDLLDRATLLVAWNPECGFCSRLAPELREWQASAAPTAPRVVLVSQPAVRRSTRTSTRTRFVLLDPTGTVMRALGAPGTPMAVLVDGAGRVASPVLRGGPAVMATARGEQPVPALAS